jgi:dipeptide/tripeptide permease
MEGVAMLNPDMMTLFYYVKRMGKNNNNKTKKKKKKKKKNSVFLSLFLYFFFFFFLFPFGTNQLSSFYTQNNGWLVADYQTPIENK